VSPRLLSPFLLLALVACGGHGTAELAPREVPESGLTDGPPVPDAVRFGFRASGPAPAAAAPAAPDLAWATPEGWRRGPEKSMRLATFLVGDSGRTEVSLIHLPGSAGGDVANIQRWYGQMGQPEPTADEIGRLPTLEVLGRPSPLVEIAGSFSGMGREEVGEAVLIATLAEAGGRTLFIKMTGPREEVEAARRAFVEFCSSLRSP